MTKLAISLSKILYETVGHLNDCYPPIINIQQLVESSGSLNYEIDIHELLEKHHMVAVIWSIEDVQSVRPDLRDDQAWEVLQNCRRVHDCEIGFTWLLIETIADDMFPAPDEGDGQ